SGSQVYEFQFSDNAGPFYDLAGASATTSATVYDYEAPFNHARDYRVLRVNTSPYLASNPSSILSLTLPTPAGQPFWTLSTLGGSPIVLAVGVTAWKKLLRKPQNAYYPPSAPAAVVLSAG